MSHPPLPYQFPQLLERFLSKLILTFPPPQTSRKIIASPQRNNRQQNIFRIDSVFIKLTHHPHHSSITSADNSNYGFLIRCALSEMFHTFLSVLSETVEICVVDDSVEVEIYFVDLR